MTAPRPASRCRQVSALIEHRQGLHVEGIAHVAAGFRPVAVLIDVLHVPAQRPVDHVFPLGRRERPTRRPARRARRVQRRRGRCPSRFVNTRRAAGSGSRLAAPPSLTRSPSGCSDQKLKASRAEQARDRVDDGPAVLAHEHVVREAVLLQVAEPARRLRRLEDGDEHVAQVLGAVEGIHRHGGRGKGPGVVEDREHDAAQGGRQGRGVVGQVVLAAAPRCRASPGGGSRPRSRWCA